MLNFTKENVIDASNDLSDKAFKLWLYLVVDNTKVYIDKFFTGRNYNLRCLIFNEEFQSAWEELVEKEYIIKDTNTWYQFRLDKEN